MTLHYRMAGTNYPMRVLSFGYSFAVYVALLLERGIPLDFRTLVVPGVVLLVYPHLAWLATRLRGDSARAELDNLLLDSMLLGIVLAEAGLPLWLVSAVLVAIFVNNAACGGVPRLGMAVFLLAGAALAWALLFDTPFLPESGPIVTLLCMAGTAAYVGAVGLVMHAQTKRLTHARDALVRSESQFRFIAEHAGEFVAVLDSRSHICYVSGAYQERFDPNLIRSGAHWTSLIDRSDRERARNLIVSVLRSGRGARISLNFTAADGTLLNLDCAASRLDEPGVPGNFLIMVTSRLPTPMEGAMQAGLPEVLKRHHAAYGLLLTDMLGRIEAASPRMGEMLGYTPAELIGKTIGEIAESIPASDTLIEDVWREAGSQRTFQCKFLALNREGKLKLAWANVVELQLHPEDGTRRLAWTIVDDPALTLPQDATQAEAQQPRT